MDLSVKSWRDYSQTAAIRPEWLWALLTILLLPGCIDENGSGAQDRQSGEQRWNMFTSTGHAPYEGGIGSLDVTVDYWTWQNLGGELREIKVAAPRDTVASSDPPDYESAICFYFYLDPTLAKDRCYTNGESHLTYYARHMREQFDLTDSTDRVVFLVHPTLDFPNRYTPGATPIFTVAYSSLYMGSAAFVFRDRADAVVQEEFDYYPIGDWDSQQPYREALVRLTSLTMIHEFGHLTYGLGHADYDSSGYAGNATHNMAGPRCVLNWNLQKEDILSDFGGRWPLHFCDGSNSCRQRIRDRYGM